MAKIIIYFLFNSLFLYQYLGKPVEHKPEQNTQTLEQKCTDCHSDLMSNNIKHPAAIDGGCTNCHQVNDTLHPDSKNKSISLLDKVPDLCYYCHEPKNVKSTKHPPVEEGECLTCHNPHSSANKNLLNDSPTSSLCYMCHDLALDTNKSIHGPVKKGKCTSCHNPHQSDNEKLLLSDSKTLCLKCHNKTIKNGNHTIENIGQAIAPPNNIHPALEMDGCLTCHSGHASANSNLLIDKFPSGTYSDKGVNGFSLCFTCHDSQKMTEEKTTEATNFRNGNKNLHYVHLEGNKSRSCAICHNVHGSKNEHLINTEVPFGSWKMKMNYTANENGGSCAPGCHEKKAYNRIIQSGDNTNINKK